MQDPYHQSVDVDASKLVSQNNALHTMPKLIIFMNMFRDLKHYIRDCLVHDPVATTSSQQDIVLVCLYIVFYNYVLN